MTAPRRVCLDLTPSETRDRFGGFTRYGLALLAHLLALPASERAGIELLVLARSDGAPEPAEYVSADRLLSGPLVPADVHTRQRRRLGSVLRAARVDLFHALHPEALPWRCGCTLVSTVADLVCEVLPQPGESRWRRARNAVRHRLRHARPDHLIAISNTTRDDLARVMHIPASRIDVVPLAVDTARFAPHEDPVDRASLVRLGLSRPYFISVGSDHYRKNQQRLFEGWLAVADRVPESLVFVGRQLYGDAFTRIVARARSAGLEGRVAWLPDLDDDQLPGLYRMASALIAPSEYEGFGMTLLEAMACGTPVAASRAPAHCEVAGDAAIFFDALSATEISAALRRMSEDEELRRSLRARGVERARQFTWERCARETLQVYRRLLFR